MIDCDQCIYDETCPGTIKECRAHKGGVPKTEGESETSNESVENNAVYCVWDNSCFERQLLGIFASRELARQWLNREYDSGALMSYEYKMASIEKEEVISYPLK